MSRIAPKKVQDPTNLDESYDKTINQVILYLNHLVGDKKVLVVGGKHVGKTRLINSLYLALTQTDTELMSPSTKNFSISSKSLYKRGPKASKKPTNLLFYDTTGLESCDDQNKLATILRFILEGKIGEKEFRWSLMQDETSIRAKHKIQETSPERVFKAVIFVENDYNDGDAVTIADTLTKAIKRSDNNLVKKIPVLRILVDSHHEYITKNNQCSMSKDEKLSKKHDFGLCKTRINIQPYVWTDAFTEYDLDYDHDNPKGYLQVQKELLMEFEYRKKLKEQGQLTSDLDMEMGLSRDQSKHLNGPGKKNLKFEGPVNMTDSGLLNGQLDSVELIKRQNKLKRDDYFDKTFENFIVDQNNNKVIYRPKDLDNILGKPLSLIDKIKNSNSNTPISSSNNLSKPNFEQRRRSTQIPLQTDILLMNQPQNAYLPTGIQQSTSKNSSKNSAPTSDTSSQMIMSANNMNHTQNNSNNHENLSESKGDHMSTDMLTSSNSNSNLINSTSLIDPSLSMDKKSYSVENLNLLSNLKEAVGKNSEKSKNLDETELPLQNKSDRFEFNVRLGPEDITKKKSLSLLLLLEYLLDIIYHEDSVTSHVWKIKPNSGARSQDREIPLTDLFKSLMGRSNNNSSSRPMMFRRN